MQKVRITERGIKVEKIQFIKNLKGNLVCKSFRKYNIVLAWYSEHRGKWVHYTKFGIHFIPKEYVKIYKH